MNLSGLDLREYFNFTLRFCREARQERGEDSFCYGLCRDAGFLGVFDGCGGLGAQTRDRYSGKTEAYMASRMCAGAAYDWFCETFPRQKWPEDFRDLQERYINPVLRRFRAGEEGALRIKGTMSRPLPTTAAMALYRLSPSGGVNITSLWAGDSRVYVLTPNAGLAQLTADDCTQPDPFENLYDDGILTNVISADGNYRLHTAQISVAEPCLLFAATDGCFGYVSTPMEFEAMLLSTLLQAKSVSEWESALAYMIGSAAGDDYTLVLASLGFQGFESIRRGFQRRGKLLYDQYLRPMSQMNPSDRDSRRDLWQQYRTDYTRLWR